MKRSDPFIAFSLDCQHLGVWADADTAAVNSPTPLPPAVFCLQPGIQKHFIDCALGNFIWLNGYVLTQNKW